MDYFPKHDHPALQPFTQAFVRLMFAHARFERRVRDLLDVINPDLIGSNECDNWPAHERANKTRELIAKCLDKHPRGIPEVEEIVRFLSQAVDLCHERNRLAHGTWWSFDAEAQTMTIRSDRNWPEEEQHQKRRYTEIEQSAMTLEEIEIELYKIQHEIDTRRQQGS